MNKRLFYIDQIAKIVLTCGARKVQQFKMADGNFRYQIKDFTELEHIVFERGENMTDFEKEAYLEKGNWIILDAFTASALSQVYNALSVDMQIKMRRLSLQTNANFAFKWGK